MVEADADTDDIARRNGRGLRESRVASGKTQAAVGAEAGVSQSAVSEMENGRGDRFTLRVWGRVAAASGTKLRVYLDVVSAADLPRDHVHARAQKLILRTALTGGWAGEPEVAIDAEPSRSRSADVVLRRGAEHAVVEVWDWFNDIGESFRSSDRKVARINRTVTARQAFDGPTPRVGCLWVIRSTRRNRALLSEFATLFRSRFPGSNRAWLAALTDPTVTMPAASGMLWISVDGTTLSAVQLPR